MPLLGLEYGDVDRVRSLGATRVDSGPVLGQALRDIRTNQRSAPRFSGTGLDGPTRAAEGSDADGSVVCHKDRPLVVLRGEVVREDLRGVAQPSAPWDRW